LKYFILRKQSETMSKDWLGCIVSFYIKLTILKDILLKQTCMPWWRFFFLPLYLILSCRVAHIGIRSGGVARIFQRGVTVRQSEGTHQSVMLFLPPVACCLLQKDLQKGRSGAPKDPPSYPPEGYTVELILLQVSFLIVYFLAAI